MNNETLTRKLPIILLLSGVWTLIGASFAGISYLASVEEGLTTSILSIFLSAFVRFYVWAGLSLLIFQIVKMQNPPGRKTQLRNSLVHIPLSVIFSAFHSVIYAAVLWFFNPAYGSQFSTVLEFFKQYIFFGNVYVGILIYALITISIQAFFLYRRFQFEESRAAQLKVELVSAQLQSLKMQLHPHFLFNTLHSISSLNLVDPHKANAMIARLGEFLRMTLDHSDEQMVTLADELEFLRCYLEIELIRFSDRLNIKFDIEPDTLPFPVPHLILQPIVENSIKHGISPRAAPGFIAICARRDENLISLEITDNGAGIKKSEHLQKRGKGLQNVRQRLEQIYGSGFHFEMRNAEENGLTVSLQIPYLVNCDFDARKSNMKFNHEAKFN